MSAFLCDEQHIGQLALKIYDLKLFKVTHGKLSPRGIAAAMAHENIQSLKSRYGDIEFFLGAMTVEEYMQGCEDATESKDLNLKPVDIVKMAQCYAYQSCEHPEWRSSQPKRWVRDIEADFIRTSPGYNDAQWGYDGRDAFLTRSIHSFAAE